ncbi:MAG: hypothetical protein U9R32_04040 [Bacteroidota bacterium]|nr:hypothetical protein [Bacteroidota bacterium]
MMRAYIKIFIALLSLLFSYLVEAQEATAVLDSNNILIGDQTHVRLQVNVPENSTVIWPFFQDTLTSQIEILNISSKSETISNKIKTIDQNILITTFDTGQIVIPPITFKSLLENDTDLFKTNPLLLHVSTIKVDTAQAIKTIKGPMESPLTFADMLPWILLAHAIVLLILGLIWYFKKRKKNQPIFAPKPKPIIPAYITALENLNTLKRKKLWQNGRIKQYHSELTYELRLYLEKEYNIAAIEYTSNEILDNINNTKINKDAIGKLESCLILADMAKFAKYEPLPLENDTSLNFAIDFINETKQLPITEPASKKGVTNVE